MSERSVKDTRPSDSYLPVVNVDYLTGLPVPVGGANGAGTAAAAMRVTYASDGATVPVATAPSTAATAGTSGNATTVAAGSLILKASAGNLYSFNAVSGASAGYLLVYDSATVPADGATTPRRAYVMAANSSIDISLPIPDRFAAGITLVFSTTGPFLKTISATAFLAGEFA